MPPRDPIPKYRRHKQSGQAVVTLTDGFGGRNDVLLGKYGSAASRAEYDRAVAQWLAAGRQLPRRPAEGDLALTVAELAAAFMKFAHAHYRRPDGTPTSEICNYVLTVRPLVHLYGRTAAAEFGPLAFKAVRQLMLDGYEHPRHGRQEALARRLINQRMNRIRRLFKWGVENELVPASVAHGLAAVQGLQRGRSEARETEPVKPVAEAVVEATLPFLPPAIAAAVRLQLLTGMRPGELLAMTAGDLDTTGPVWLYTPGRHKTEHHGHKRVVALGPQAQEIVRGLLKTDLAAPLFSPKETLRQRYEVLRENRKTPVQPSQMDRGKRRPKRKPGTYYTVGAYGRAVARGCDEAFPPPAPLARRPDERTKKAWLARLAAEGRLAQLKAWRVAHRWHPHQLRHTAATKIRREFGLDTARVVLGHRSPAITELYAEIDVARAAEAMGKIG